MVKTIASKAMDTGSIPVLRTFLKRALILVPGVMVTRWSPKPKIRVRFPGFLLWLNSVMVSTLDSDSRDIGSSPVSAATLRV